MSPSRSWLCLAVLILAGRGAAQQHPLLTPEQFFRASGAGLRSIEEERSSYWQPHIDNSHKRILEAAAMCERRATALVLGAGNCTEIPLEELARKFDEVILVDLDEESMAAAAEELPDELLPKVHFRVEDVTTFAAPLMRLLWQSAEASDSAEQAFQRFAKTLDSLNTQPSPFQFPEADLVVSSLVLSELHRYPLNYADRLVRDKFGKRLVAWPGYENFRARLELIALQDHVSLLAKSCRRGGAIAFSDTIARGPSYEKIPAARRRDVLLAMSPDLDRLGLFKELQQQESLRGTFAAAFEKMRARWDGESAIALARPAQEPASREKTLAVIEQLAVKPRSLPEPDRGAACETLVNLLCNERFPVAAETEVLERLLDLYAAGPGHDSFESLVPLEALRSEWQSQGLKPQGEAASWWWLEYPCSISYSSGAFQIRSWILKQEKK